jgi:Contractile injection system tube protein
MPGLLTNLKILGFKDVNGIPFDVPLLFECMFNPDSYKTEHKATYCSQQPVASPPQHNFQNVSAMRFSLEFVIDGTGVSSDLEIPIPIPVPVQVLLFNTVTLDVKGETHRPNYLFVQWGTFIRACFLESSSITYTVFDSFGIPLRAKINATFIEDAGSKLNQIASMFSSPDLTHSKLVQESDILPLMVFREYKTQDHYLQVARANKLKNFRKLEPGTTINFPPISIS